MPRAEPVPPSEMARFDLEASWACWALDYLPSNFAGDAFDLRTVMLASSNEAATP